MPDSGPTSVLIITPADFDKMSNDRDRVRWYVPPGGRLVFVYKAINQAGGRWRLLRDACTCTMRRRMEDGIELVAVDPFLNFFAGYRRNAEAGATSRPGPPSLRLRLIRLLSPLSVLRDAVFLPALVLAVLLRVRGRCDVCIGVGPWGGLAGWVLRWLGRVRLLTYRDRDYEPGLVPEGVRRRYTAAAERFAVRRADLVISSGGLLAELREEQTGRPAHVVTNGVEWERYAGARATPRHEPSLIYVGNVISWSGIEHAIGAMPAIRLAFPTARLLVVGDGQPAYMERLRGLIAAEGLESCVELLGRRTPEEMPDLLARAMIGLANSEPNPFRRYAFPIKVVEYMAAGVPVIGTEGTETARIMAEHGCGLAIPYDRDVLAETVVGLLRDERRWRTMRDRGVCRSAEMTWRTLVEREMELIGDAWTRRADPDRGDGRGDGSS